MSTEKFVGIVIWKLYLEVVDKKQQARVSKLKASSLTALVNGIQGVVNIESKRKKILYILSKDCPFTFLYTGKEIYTV